MLAVVRCFLVITKLVHFTTFYYKLAKLSDINAIRVAIVTVQLDASFLSKYNNRARDIPRTTTIKLHAKRILKSSNFGNILTHITNAKDMRPDPITTQSNRVIECV